MFPNTYPQSQDLFQACLGFARQLSKSPGLYCRLEVKLGDNFFNFQTGSPGRFPGKRKSPSNYRRDQRLRTPPDKEIPTPGNHGAESVAPGDPTGARNGIFPPASSSPLCSRTVTWSRHLFSPLRPYRSKEMEYFPQPHLLQAVELCPGQSIYSLPQIYLSWMELEVLYLKMDWISR